MLDEEVAWISRGTARGMSIRSAIPDGFDVYGLLDLDDEARPIEDSLLNALQPEPDEVLVAGWIVRSDRMTEPGDEHTLYSGWLYRCRHVQRTDLLGRPARDGFPDLLFPPDHRWIVSTLWDDSWRSVGVTATQALEIARLLPGFEPIDPTTDISTTGRDVR